MKARILRLASWLVERELLWLLLASPALLFPTAFRPGTLLALASIPLLWLCRWLGRGRLTVRSLLDIPILGIMMVLPVSLIVSVDAALSLPKFTGLILGIALYYALLNSPDVRPVYRLMPLLSLAVVVLGLVGIDWHDFKIPLLSPLYRHLPRLIQGVPRTMQGGFHPNEVGGTLAMLIPLLLAPLLARDSSCHLLESSELSGRWHTGSSLRSLSLGLALLAATFTLILTQSRTAIVATLAALLFMGALHSRVVLYAAAAAVAGLILALWRWGATPLLEAALKLPGSYTWQGRPEIWRNAWQVLCDYPLTGIGLNTFAPVSRARYTYLLAPPDWDFVHAHNILLQVGVDLGLIGLACFLAFLVVFFLVGLRTYSTAQDRTTRWLISGLMASMAAYLAFGSIDAITLGAKPALLVWMSAGLLVRLAREERRKVPTVNHHAEPLSRPRPAKDSGVSARFTGLEFSGRPSDGRMGLVAWSAVAFITLIAIAIWHNLLASIALSNLGQLAINRAHRVGTQHAASLPAQRAASLLEQAIRLEPRNRSAQRALAEVYIRLGRETEALALWREAGVSGRDLAERGEALRRSGSPPEAQRWVEWALALQPELGDAWYYLGLIFREGRQCRKAAQALEKALAVDNLAGVSPLDVERTLGLVLVYQGQAGEASSHFQRVLSAAPDDVRTRFNLAQALSQVGDHAAAHSEFMEAIAWLERVRRQLGEAFYQAMRFELARALTTNANRRGDLAAAQHWAKEAKEISPDDAYPYADLAELYIAKGMYQEAIAECESFLQRRSDASAIYYLLGQAQAAAGDYPGAIQAYENALRLRPGLAAYHYVLARALEAKGELERAAQELARAKALGPDIRYRVTGHDRLLSD